MNEDTALIAPNIPNHKVQAVDGQVLVIIGESVLSLAPMAAKGLAFSIDLAASSAVDQRGGWR